MAEIDIVSCACRVMLQGRPFEGLILREDSEISELLRTQSWAGATAPALVAQNCSLHRAGRRSLGGVNSRTR